MAASLRPDLVTPHVGVWIETSIQQQEQIPCQVTPHVGVWIETYHRLCPNIRDEVTPHVGVWIETVLMSTSEPGSIRHTSCRCVD